MMADDGKFLFARQHFKSLWIVWAEFGPVFTPRVNVFALPACCSYYVFQTALTQKYESLEPPNFNNE